MIFFKVDEVLREQGKTKYWLEKHTGLSYVTIDKIISNDTSAIRLETLDKICDALECDPANIVVKVNKGKKARK